MSMRDLRTRVVQNYLSRQAGSEKRDVLYVVHPDSILEKSADVRYVKPFLDKILTRVKSFPGLVIATKLDRSYFHPEHADLKPLWKKGYEAVQQFMRELQSSTDILVEPRSEKGSLGRAATKVLDDMYLEGTLGKIILVGCFKGHSGISMCVEDTAATLEREYGKEHVVIDDELCSVAGLVDYDELNKVPHNEGLLHHSEPR